MVNKNTDESFRKGLIKKGITEETLKLHGISANRADEIMYQNTELTGEERRIIEKEQI